MSNDFDIRNAEAVAFYESLGLTADTKSDLEENPFFEIDLTKL